MPEPTLPRRRWPALSSVLEGAGLVAITTGAALLAPWAGWLTGGLLLVLAGVALDVRERR